MKANQAKRFLPNELEESIKNIEFAKGKPLNFSLYLNKYAIFTLEEGNYKARIKEAFEHVVKKFGSTGKRKFMLPIDIFPLQYYQNYLDRFKALQKALMSQGYFIEFKALKVLWRLAIGLGSPNIYECSINLNRNYSVPIIPGSAVKGITSHYARDRLPNEEQRSEFFGSSNQKGKVIFFDALPIFNSNTNFLSLDIMNVHYKKYYEQGETPGDWMKPDLIFFPIVEKLKYQFTVASKKPELARRAIELIEEGVREEGIGAKTAVGYGYFE